MLPPLPLPLPDAIFPFSQWCSKLSSEYPPRRQAIHLPVFLSRLGREQARAAWRRGHKARRPPRLPGTGGEMDWSLLPPPPYLRTDSLVIGPGSRTGLGMLRPNQTQSDADGREWGRRGEGRGSEGAPGLGMPVCLCLQKTTWGSVCFVCLTIYQHPAGFETPKPLNGCLTNWGFLTVRQGKGAFWPSAGSPSFHQGRGRRPPGEIPSCNPGSQVWAETPALLRHQAQ